MICVINSAQVLKQEIKVAKVLCKILIITDGTKSFWINALNGENIKDSKGNEIKTVFNPISVSSTTTIEYLIDEIDSSINASSSMIRSTKLIDPTPLATRLWQTIWVATGKSPIKCLYNVVELFIFKFLSDLHILSEDTSFNSIYQKALRDPEEALEFYARNTRLQIHKLFPHGEDGTTIINGTIFVTEKGEANLSQSILFKRSLEHLQKYSEEFGSLTTIDKQFKTRLYESFLKQEVEALGQYFTPRKVIQSVIKMSGIDEPSFSFSGKRICDPFCGVGGFLLEILNLNDSIKNSFYPDRDGKISTELVLHGFDKGFERDDERTIILAKANMLIYLTELLFSNPKCTKEFSNIFNNTFRLFKDNLGTFGHIIKEESKKYDLILSNPPYVTSGSSIIKEEIKNTRHTANEYPINALGLEGLSIEWIVKSLKTSGRAFLIIPDGILGRVGGKKLRDYILHECYLDAIVSLPARTFFANSEHTYILVITKKNKPSDIQKEPVFTYLVSNIGERLTSVKREEINEDDLPQMEKLFRVFLATKSLSKEILEKESPRCKIQEFNNFQKSSHWVINRWWSQEELVSAGIKESPSIAQKPEMDKLLAGLNTSLEDYEKFVEQQNTENFQTKSVTLGDTSLFRLFNGKRIKKEDLPVLAGEISAYSANVFEPFGYVSKTNIEDFSCPSILYGIDGNFNFNLIPSGQIFATTDHCGTIQIIDSSILPEYILYALEVRRIEETFNRSFRASLANMRQFTIEIPIKNDGSFDVDAQKNIADFFMEDRKRKNAINNLKQQFDEIFERYMNK
ncbi:MAG: class I SAM-dependent DNA methyltransferase [Stenomitos frigidus ULC029]